MASTITNSVCDVFKRQIRTGDLKVGDAFPSIRNVAAQHKLAYATAVRVVDQLIAEGYLDRHGKRPAVVRGVPKRSMVVGVAYNVDEANFKHPASVKLLYALTEAHLARGHRLQLLPIKDDDWSDALDFAREHRALRLGGIITLGGVGTTDANDSFTVVLREYGIPVVQLGSRSNEMSSVWPLVTEDMDRVGAEAVKIFHQLGRQRIGAIVGRWARIDGPYSLLRGIYTQMQQLGIPWDESCCEHIASWSETSGYQATRRLLDKGKFDAIICQDDINSLGAIREFKARGLRVPDDIALIGVGDLLAPDAGVAMSTFDLQYDKIARQAVRLLEQQADGETFAGHDVAIPPVYISRKTCPECLPAGRVMCQ